ncbi:hypothetical protein ZIOFF_028885 [Zingiber officinale]|uniref:Transformation/transcription domain-associated protein n=1 Tax=Zingiber officinale TaxID=94328 RepID=A0A8J5GLW7_ZINOF|nr:hypothetical protein ZIOFF_028885 [Zingiber officinale]
MAPILNYEQHAQRLIEPDLCTYFLCVFFPLLRFRCGRRGKRWFVHGGFCCFLASAAVQMRLQMVMEVRDSLEIAHTAEYLNFLRCYFRAFTVILTQLTSPQTTESVEHKLRNVVVEILNRLPHSEVLRPFVQDLLKLSLSVLTNDNEDNAFISVRIIFDLLRNFRPTVEAEVQPFIDFVCSIYRNFPATVSHIFNSNSSPSTSSSTGPAVASPSPPPPPSSHLLGSRGDDGSGLDAPPGHGGIGGVVSPYSGTGQLNPSTRSFKIVTESPLVVMFLFQLYPKLVQTNIPYLLPLLVSSISITGPEKVSNNQKPQFVELKGAQVKTLSFLTYLLKTHADYIKPHEESICKSIVNLLVTCPDSVSIRKVGCLLSKNTFLLILAYLVSKEMILTIYFDFVIARVLIGTGRVCIETLRPLAYSLLAEMVHYVRGELSLAQVC